MFYIITQFMELALKQANKTLPDERGEMKKKLEVLNKKRIYKPKVFVQNLFLKNDNKYLRNILILIICDERWEIDENKLINFKNAKICFVVLFKKEFVLLNCLNILIMIKVGKIFLAFNIEKCDLK